MPKGIATLKAVLSRCSDMLRRKNGCSSVQSARKNPVFRLFRAVAIEKPASNRGLNVAEFGFHLPTPTPHGAVPPTGRGPREHVPEAGRAPLAWFSTLGPASQLRCRVPV